MKEQSITILERERPKVEMFFRSGSLVLNANDLPGATLCEKCIDVPALIAIMRAEFEPAANLNPYTDWLEDDGYKGFLMRLYAHYDTWKENENAPGETEALCTNKLFEK